jgi:hypothetical protein
MGSGFLSRGQSGRGVALTNHPHVAPRLRKSRAIPLLPFWTFVACSRVKFTLDIWGIFGTLPLGLKRVGFRITARIALSLQGCSLGYRHFRFTVIADKVKLPKDTLVWEAETVQDGEMSLEFYSVRNKRLSGRCITQHGDGETANRRSNGMLLHVGIPSECK